MTFYALQKWRASAANQLLPLLVRKGADEPVTNATTGTTLQDDNELFVTVAANVTYAVDIAVIAVEAAGTGIDIKMAWTFPANCTLDLATVAPHTAWTGVAAALEVEWASWTGETSSPSSSKSFGSNNVASFGYHFHGSLQVGATGGTFRLQWAQVNASASALTVKAGSRMWLQPIPS